MRALTLHQPWASLIAYGAPTLARVDDDGHPERLFKTIETRNWGGRMARFQKGERLAIHAGKTFDREGRRALVAAFSVDLSDVPMPAGAIVAVAEVNRVRPLFPEHCLAALFPGRPEMHRFGIWLRNVRALTEPVPCRGMQGIWNVPRDVLARVEELTGTTSSGGCP